MRQARSAARSLAFVNLEYPASPTSRACALSATTDQSSDGAPSAVTGVGAAASAVVAGATAFCGLACFLAFFAAFFARS